MVFEVKQDALLFSLDFSHKFWQILEWKRLQDGNRHRRAGRYYGDPTPGSSSVQLSQSEPVLLARLILEITRSANGELDVSVDQARVQTLCARDLMIIQQAVELRFFEILASLPEEMCPRAKRLQKR